MPTGYYNGTTSFEELFVTTTEYHDSLVGNELWVWGLNTAGRLGDGTTISQSSPVQTIVGGTTWASINDTQYDVSAAIKSDGTLWLWGNNASYGGLGVSGSALSSPTQVGGAEWKQVSCSDDSTAAIKIDGTAWCWGRNNQGQLGDGTTVNKSSPVQVISGGTTWRHISVSDDVTAAIKADGTLWTWGNGTWGGLGDGTTVSKSSPVQTIAAGISWVHVTAGLGRNVAAIKQDGTLWVWGANGWGQLGDGTTVNKSSPVQTIVGGTGWKQVSMSLAVGAVRTDGTLWMWGYNQNGELGDGTTIYRSSPVQTIAAGTMWKQVSCGNMHTAAIKLDGTLWTWGYNGSGRLGDGTTVSRSSPVQIVSGTDTWKVVSAGFSKTLAIHDGATNLYAYFNSR